jgi:hypothetical protein
MQPFGRPAYQMEERFDPVRAVQDLYHAPRSRSLPGDLLVARRKRQVDRRPAVLCASSEYGQELFARVCNGDVRQH